MNGEETPALEEWLQFGLTLLELLAVLLGLVLVAMLIARLLTSLWRVTVGKRIAILPFEGTDKASLLGQLLPRRWTSVERRLLDDVGKIRGLMPHVTDSHPSFVSDGSEDLDDGQDAEAAGTVAEDNFAVGGSRLGAMPRLRPLDVPTSAQFEVLRSDPIERELSPISLGGVSVSPGVVLDLLRRIEAAVARRTIRGTIHELAGTVTMSLSQRDPGHDFDDVEVIVDATTGAQLIQAVEDLAFAAIKSRRRMQISMVHWGAYEAALHAYRHQLSFEWTAAYDERDRAIEEYARALKIEPDDAIVNYNQGILLYARYVEAETNQAIKHFMAAARAEEVKWRALAYAGLAMSYCQLIHRYDYPNVPSSGLAVDASRRALELEPELEEVAFSEGFALQVSGLLEEAIQAYERTTNLPGDTRVERRFKSFASNNAGWIKMTHLGDASGAKEAFDLALELWPENKMSYANLGELCRRRLDFDGAMEHYGSALELDPQYINGANELGMICLEKARADAQGSKELLRLALSWHNRALSLITGDSPQQEAAVRKRFTECAEAEGFIGLLRSDDAVGKSPARKPREVSDPAAGR